MTHIVDTMASLQALRGSRGEPSVKANPIPRPPVALHAPAARPITVTVPLRKGGHTWARS